MKNKREEFPISKPPTNSPELNLDYFDWRRGKATTECLSQELTKQTEKEKQEWEEVDNRVRSREKEYEKEGVPFPRTMSWLNDEQLGYILATAAKTDIELSLKYNRLDVARPYDVLSKKDKEWKIKLNQVIAIICDKILKGEQLTSADFDSTKYPDYPYDRFDKNSSYTKEQKDGLLDSAIWHSTLCQGMYSGGKGLLSLVPYIFSVPKSKIATVFRSMFEDIYKEQLAKEASRGN